MRRNRVLFGNELGNEIKKEPPEWSALEKSRDSTDYALFSLRRAANIEQFSACTHTAENSRHHPTRSTTLCHGIYSATSLPPLEEEVDLMQFLRPLLTIANRARTEPQYLLFADGSKNHIRHGYFSRFDL